jgi:hypothetical protein
MHVKCTDYHFLCMFPKISTRSVCHSHFRLLTRQLGWFAQKLWYCLIVILTIHWMTFNAEIGIFLSHWNRSICPIKRGKNPPDYSVLPAIRRRRLWPDCWSSCIQLLRAQRLILDTPNLSLSHQGIGCTKSGVSYFRALVWPIMLLCEWQFLIFSSIKTPRFHPGERSRPDLRAVSPIVILHHLPSITRAKSSAQIYFGLYLQDRLIHGPESTFSESYPSINGERLRFDAHWLICIISAGSYLSNY